MATKTTPPAKKSKKKFLESAGKALMKGAASTTLGASVGVVEEAVGEKAGMGARAGMALAGMAVEIFVDPDENPILAEAGKASMHTAGAITGYKAGRKVTRKSLDAKAERDQKATIERLKKDMEDDDKDDDAKTGAKGATVAKKAAKKKPNAKQQPQD